MRLLSYAGSQRANLGILSGNKIIPFTDVLLAMGQPASLDLRGEMEILKFLQAGAPALSLAGEAVRFVECSGWNGCLSLDQVSLLAPVPRPGKVVCVAGNYPSQPGQPCPEYPTLFLKPSSSVTGYGSIVRLSQLAQDVTYEVELAVVIGKLARFIPETAAGEYIAGYMPANDLGDRTLEKRTSQWTTGKMMDSFTPLGPYLVTAGEAPETSSLELRTRLNGRLVQHGNTQDMFFKVPYLISYLSHLTTLEPGDVILTGCPKLMPDGRPAVQLSLKAGDQVEVEIAGLGKLWNPVGMEEETLV